MQRLVFKALGVLFVATGLIGVFLPLLPTTVFFVLATACFARSSPALERWILNHPRFGPTVVAWRENGVIPTSAKALALTGMLLGFFAFSAMVHPRPALQMAVAVFLAVCALFVVTRPSRP